MDNLSFKRVDVKNEVKTKEEKIMKDVDRLGAMGTIGIAKCFAAGAGMHREIYSSEIKLKLHKPFKHYKQSKTTSVNHFYEKLKLLLFKNRLNTKTTEKITQRRHKFLSFI